MVTVVLLNEGTDASPIAASITPEWLAAVAAAATIQLNRDVAPAWGGSYSVRVGSDPTDIAPGEIVYSLVDTLPEAPGAVAYHDRTGTAVPFALLALSTCNTLTDVSIGITHELCEIAGDAACNEWRDDGQGNEYANETCDADEARSYPIDSIAVSAFVLPAFFSPGSPGPYTFLGSIGQPDAAGPFQTMYGGYQIKRQSGGGEAQVQGEVHPLRLARKQHWNSRTYRRGVRL